MSEQNHVTVPVANAEAAPAVLDLPDAAGPRTELTVRGMNCASCVQHVTQALRALPGVDTATVDLEAGAAAIYWKAGFPGDAVAAIDAIQAAGYGAAFRDRHDHDHAPPDRWDWSVWIGGIATLTLMLGEWVFGLGGAAWFRYLAFVLSSIVQFYGGHRLYVGAWRQLKAGSSNMDTLVALGSTTAYI